MVSFDSSRWFSLTLLALTGFALTACSSDDTGNSSDTASTSLTATATATNGTVTMGSTMGTVTNGSGSEGTMSGSASVGETVGTTAPTTTMTSTTGMTTDGTTTMGVETMGSSSSSSSTTGPACTLACDDEGTKVLCDGEVYEDCSANGQYCAAGECVDTPCDAAFKEQRSEGCEFWAVKTGLISAGNGACFAAFVANTWSEPVHINVEYDGQQLAVGNFARIPSGQGANIVYDPYDANAGLAVGEVAILFLSRGPGGFPTCPGNAAAITDETAVINTGRGKAFHITTDFPVAAYQMLPYGGGSVAATSATLLLPSGTWDTNYIAINAFTKSAIVADGFPHIVLVGNEDGTAVTIEPKVAIQGGNGVEAAAAGQPKVYMLDRGETIQIAQSAELTGSPILADKPLAVFGGATCLNVPVNGVACDGAHQQIPPVKALGNDYTGIRYRNRTGQEESPPWRLVGAVDGTELTWTNKPLGAPDTIGLGTVAEFNSGGPFQVESQDEDHPFYLGAYMTGGANYGGAGDPEWVNVIPSAQFLKKYVLFTDPTYSETSLVVVRSPVDGVFKDVSIGCAGNLGGWMPIGENEYTRLDLVTGNFQDVNGCSNGRHEMASENPFGVTVWGWGSTASQFNTVYVSYAYPAGASVQGINDVEVLPQ